MAGYVFLGMIAYGVGVLIVGVLEGVFHTHFVVWIGELVGILSFILVILFWGQVPYLVMDKNLGLAAAFDRSPVLVRGGHGIVIVYIVALLIAIMPLSMLGSRGWGIERILSDLVGSFFSFSGVVLYEHLRDRSKGDENLVTSPDPEID